MTTSPARPRSPLPWLLWAAAILLVAASTRHPLPLLILLLAVGGAAHRYRKPFPWRMTLTLVAVGAFWNLLGVHVGSHVLFRLPATWPLLGGPWTLEALLYGAANGLALAVILAAFALVFDLLSPRELARMTPAALYEAGLVLSVALTFVPQGRESLREIRQAQALRGYRGRGWRDLPPLLFPFLTLALEDALALADSLEARGFVSRRAPLALGTRLLLLAALLLPLLGSGLMLVGRKGAGGLALFLGFLALVAAFWGMKGRRPGTNGGSHHPIRADRCGGWCFSALVVIFGWSLLRLLRPEAMQYSPYAALLPAWTGGWGAALLLPLFLPSLPPLRFAALQRGSTREASPLNASRRPSCPDPAPGSPPSASRSEGLRPAPPPVRFHRVSFTYPQAEAPLFREMTLTLPPGGFILVSGASGAGKSTFLRLINGLVPQSSGGTLRGRICVGGVDTRLGTARLAPQVGLVVQRPERSFVADVVAEEVAFAPEQAGLPPAEVAARVEEALARMGIAHLYRRRIATLSGGERQRVALAAALALRPPILLLDEPLSQLDAAGREALIARLRQLHAEGMTVVVAEHRLARLRPVATQEVRLGPPLRPDPLPPLAAPSPEVALRVEGLTVGYGEAPPILRDLSFTLRKGEIVALLAPNGAGKSTLFKALVGLLPLRTGRIFCCGEPMHDRPLQERVRRIGYLPQDPDLLLFAETVAEEVRFTRRNHGLPEDEAAVRALLASLGLEAVADRYPRDLSVGERQRVALAAVLAPCPALLLLDEPTRGLDAQQAAALTALLRRWSAAGMTVLVASHNRDWAAAMAHRTMGPGGER